MKNYLPIIPILLGCCLLLIQCSVENGRGKDISDFYYPVEKLDNGLVYVYQNPLADSIAPFFQYYRTLEQADSSYLVGVQYNAAYIPRQLTREQVLHNGVKLVQSFIYQTDSSGRQVQVPLEINHGALFPFKVKPNGGIFLYNIRWFDHPGDTSKFTRIIRNRRYLCDTTFQFKGESLPAVKFELREIVENYQEGYWEQEFSGFEVYAKGLGLACYQKAANGFEISYSLADTMSMDALEAEFESYLRNQN